MKNVNGLMPIEDAIGRMLLLTSSVDETENVDLFSGAKRILASDLVSPVNVPPANNSAMDGYAFNSQSDLSTSLRLVGTVLAGAQFDGVLELGECVRITTGAVIPRGADTVEMQENTSLDNQHVTLLEPISKGQNVRLAGEDIAQGSTIVTAGTALTPAHLSLIASIGIASVDVTRKIKVAVIATGDELVEPGKSLGPGKIYESNRYAINAMLSELKVEVINYPIVKDQPSEIKRVLLEACSTADMVITSGGVSVGDADYIKIVLQEIGQIDFWKVAIKPGKPFAFGKISNALFCGLPGNPVSSYVTFETLVTPLLRKLAGQTLESPLLIPAIAAATFYKRPGRTDYQRSICFLGESGNLMVKPNGKQGSGIMTSVANANCYVILEQLQSNVPQGAQVTVQLF